MPIVKVWGLPAGEEYNLRTLRKKVPAAIAAIPELGLMDEQITCLFPSDRMTYGLGEEIIIEIVGLFEKPERTEEVRHRLAEGVGSAVHGLYPNAKVECFIQTFNPNAGFWMSDTSA